MIIVLPIWRFYDMMDSWGTALCIDIQWKTHLLQPTIHRTNCFTLSSYTLSNLCFPRDTTISPTDCLLSGSHQTWFLPVLCCEYSHLPHCCQPISIVFNEKKHKSSGVQCCWATGNKSQFPVFTISGHLGKFMTNTTHLCRSQSELSQVALLPAQICIFNHSPQYCQWVSRG